MNTSRTLANSERHILDSVRAALASADAVVVQIGGKSGRLGEAIVGAAFLEGTLHAMAALGNQIFVSMMGWAEWQPAADCAVVYDS